MAVINSWLSRGCHFFLTLPSPSAPALQAGGWLPIASETIDEPHGGAINEMVWTMQDKMKELQREYSTLFKLTHPDRERFERDGWPVRWKHD
jgi:hypothetical protein